MEPIRWQVQEFESLDSTNTWLVDQARAGAAEGLVARADFQTSGRGRLDRRWEAPARSALLTSILLRPTLDESDRFLVTAIVALSARAALVRLCGVRPDVKWPNDLIVREQKLGGILAEFVPATSGPPAVVVGIGLNLSSHPAQVASTDIVEISGLRLDPVTVLDILLEELEIRRALLDSSEGRSEIRRELRRSLVTLGRAVRVERVTDVVEGVAVDVDDAGRILLENDDGVVAIPVGDVVHLRTLALHAVEDAS